MKFFKWWALAGGITVTIAYYIWTLNSMFFPYDNFVLIFTIWIVLGTYALYDLIKAIREGRL